MVIGQASYLEKDFKMGEVTENDCFDMKIRI